VLGQTVVMAAETGKQHTKREQQRGLFDSVAGLYDATRQSYPAQIVDALLATAAIGPGAAVLEIGCGTGQLTRQLAGRGLHVTAIDIGPAMADAARRTVPWDSYNAQSGTRSSAACCRCGGRSRTARRAATGRALSAAAVGTEDRGLGCWPGRASTPAGEGNARPGQPRYWKIRASWGTLPR
jgi:Methyltransferase domain